MHAAAHFHAAQDIFAAIITKQPAVKRPGRHSAVLLVTLPACPTGAGSGGQHGAGLSKQHQHCSLCWPQLLIPQQPKWLQAVRADSSGHADVEDPSVPCYASFMLPAQQRQLSSAASTAGAQQPQQEQQQQARGYSTDLAAAPAGTAALAAALAALADVAAPAAESFIWESCVQRVSFIH